MSQEVGTGWEAGRGSGVTRPVPILLSHETSPRFPHFRQGLNVPFYKQKRWQQLDQL